MYLEQEIAFLLPFQASLQHKAPAPAPVFLSTVPGPFLSQQVIKLNRRIYFQK